MGGWWCGAGSLRTLTAEWTNFVPAAKTVFEAPERSRCFSDVSVKFWSNDLQWHFLTYCSVSWIWQDISANLSFRILNLQKRCLRFQRRPIIHYQMIKSGSHFLKRFPPLLLFSAIFSFIDVLCTQWYLVAMTSPSSLWAAFDKMPFQHLQRVATWESQFKW